MFQPRKEYYPAFLSEFKGRPFDAGAIQAAFSEAKVEGKVRAQGNAEEFFAEFSIDQEHWDFHQRILFDDVLFRLLSEGYLHPSIHPVAAFYQDTAFYEFVFPFLHTAILKRMATAIRTENSASVKLILQWIEPFGTYFHHALHQMIEFIAEDVLIELNSAQINRRVPSFDTYSKVSPTLMNLLNRLPDSHQAYRDRFAGEVMHVAAWMKSDLKVNTQPVGMLTRLKLLNCSPELRMQIQATLRLWESEREAAEPERVMLKHLLWIIPLFFTAAFFIWRNTEWGRTTEDILEEQAEEINADLAAEELKWDSINQVMDTLDLNGVIARQLWAFHSSRSNSASPIAAGADGKRLDTGEEPYDKWLTPGRQQYARMEPALEIYNESSCDMIVFVRPMNSPYNERAYYLKSERSITIYDDRARDYTLRVYAGTGWSDSLVTDEYDRKLKYAGLPERAYDQLPPATKLQGRFTYPVSSLEKNLQPVKSREVQNARYPSSNGAPVVVLKGDHQEIIYDNGELKNQ